MLPAESHKPLTGLSVDADIAAGTDLLGKHVSDLQENLTIGDDYISGTLKYVTGYTGFSGDVEEQSGNYMVIHCEDELVEGVTIKCELIGGIHGPVTLDPDGILVARIISNDEILKITTSKEGYDDQVRTLSLARLTLTPEPEGD